MLQRVLLIVAILLGHAVGATSSSLAADPPGIRRLAGKHLVLVTDLKSSPAVDELPAVFDQAFPQWCAYFGVDAVKHADWQVTGYIMHDRARFDAAGLAPADLPPFLNGYARPKEFWCNDQATDYYQRHLMLHEGTHAFMFSLLGGGGPPWYAEGIAELLGTHEWKNGKLRLGYLPRSAAEVPKWGRIEIVQSEVANDRALSISRVLAYDASAHLKNEAYGWCWAAATFFDTHPKYRERFRKLPTLVKRGDFVRQFQQLFANDGRELAEAWQVFAADLDYGYDFERTELDIQPGRLAANKSTVLSVAADQGWQNTGLRVEAGKSYAVKASGRFGLATQPKTWWSEPAGVSIRYHRGIPLGRLVAAIRPDQGGAGVGGGLTRRISLGAVATLVPEDSGTLFLRVNDSSGELSDNSGKVLVTVTQP